MLHDSKTMSWPSEHEAILTEEIHSTASIDPLAVLRSMGEWERRSAR